MSLTELHRLSGVWALNALDDEEAAAFEQHLQECESCAAEAGELRETAARLGQIAEHAPPAALRARVLAAAAHTRQSPPETTREETRRPAVLAERRWFKRIGALAAAASVLGAVALGTQAVRNNNELSHEVDALRQVTAEYNQLAALMSSPGARTVSRSVEHGGSGMAVYAPSQNKVLFLAGGLPELSSDWSYQLWMVAADGPHSAGVLPTGDKLPPMVMDALAGTEKLALTVEPRGGSKDPTTAPLVVLPLTA
ncbi:anti-sigma factor [Lentzea sp. NPDC005914]|uniref:anti-sigma factor n=1 Tax=Lentzea sp. NPDC005914 TaxID=3154572 RepID=UPI0033CB7880